VAAERQTSRCTPTWGRFVEVLTRAGVLLATGGLDRGTHVVASGENITLTNGPFTESTR
jgi:hypothetical protein